jgi:VCBS repeat-containing protein
MAGSTKITGTAPGGGTTVSFSNTPQAGDDVFYGTGLSEDSLGIITLDVMGNDAGGNAKSLWSLDDGIASSTGTNPNGTTFNNDLLTQDTAFANTAAGDAAAELAASNQSLHGAKIWITADGKVKYDASTLDAAFKTELQHLGAGEYASDTFTYAIRLANGTLSWATVTVKIAGVNDAATVSSEAKTVTEGNIASALDTSGQLTITDPDTGQAHVVAQTNVHGTYGDFSIDANGAWTFIGNGAHDELAAGQQVQESFTVYSQDGTASGTVTVKINGSNDAPVAGDDSASTAEDTAVTTGNVLANDTDVDGASLVVSASDATSAHGGTVVNNGDGTFTYTPTANFHGSDSFTYTVSDGHDGTDTATVNITVNAVADLAAGDDTGSTNEDTVLNSTVAGNDSTTSGGTLSYAKASDPTNGSVTVDANGDYHYTPTANFHGSDSFTYTVTDAAAGESATKTVNITVNAVNHSPTAVADSQSISDTANTDAGTPINGLVSVLANDSDPDGGTLSVSGIRTTSAANFSTVSSGTDGVVAGSYGTLTMHSNGTYTYTPNAALDALNAGQNPTDNFVYELSDGQGGHAAASLTFNLTGTNDTSIAVNDVWLVSQGATFTAPLSWLTQNDTDPDSAVTVSSVDKVGGGSFSVSLTSGGIQIGNMSGTDATLTYTLSNGTTGTVVLHSVGTQGSADTINLGTYADYNFAYIDGENGNDTISGETDPTTGTTVQGAAGSDWLLGNNGNDTLSGGGGANILTGGAGDDVFVFDKIAGASNHVTDFSFTPTSGGSSNNDTLRFNVGAGATEFATGDGDTVVENFKAGNNATINVAGTEVAVKTDASVTNATVQSTIDSYGNITTGAFFVFNNTDLGHAAVYYDSNPHAAGGAVLVAELDNITLSGLSNFTASDFSFV